VVSSRNLPPSGAIATSDLSDVGGAVNAANGLVKITAGGILPVLDGSNLTNLPTSGHVIQDEGTPLTARANLNFVGAGITATDDAGNNATKVTVNPNFGAENIITTGTAIVGGSSINAVAVLQADSTTKGLLPPRMTTTQRNAIGTPPAGLVVFDTDIGALFLFT